MKHLIVLFSLIIGATFVASADSTNNTSKTMIGELIKQRAYEKHKAREKRKRERILIERLGPEGYIDWQCQKPFPPDDIDC